MKSELNKNEFNGADQESKEDVKNMHNSTLMTEEEYNKRVKLLLDNKFTRIFPYLVCEWRRITSIVICFGLISFVNNFLKDFRNTIASRYLDPQSVEWFKIIGFPATIYASSVANNLNKKYKNNTKTLKMYLLYSMGVFSVVCILHLLQSFVWFGEGWCYLVSVGSSFDLRGLTFIKTLNNMLNYLTLSIIYVVSAVVPYVIITSLFSLFLQSMISRESYKRYSRIVTIFSNIAMLVCIYLTKITNNGIEYCKHDNFIWVCGFIFLISILAFGVIYCCLLWIDWECSVNPLFIGEENIRLAKKSTSSSKATKPKNNSMGIFDVFKKMASSKLLASICIITFSYNFTVGYASSISSACYNAYVKYLSDNPSKNFNHYQVNKSYISNVFRASEGKLLSYCTIWLMLSPLFSYLFENFGVGLFGSMQPVFSFILAMGSVVFAAVNYPESGAEKKDSILFLPKITWFEVNLEKECQFISMLSFLNRLSKYAFYDYLMECVFSNINDQDRFLYKNIANSFFGKGGQMLSSVIAILFEFSGVSSDSRYTCVVLAAFICTISVISVFGAFYISKKFNESVKDGKFIEDVPFGSTRVN
ncbi:ADP/ATP carrier protein 4 [Hepatospora eriocheir]|uniref:ADP/ATP carrier protein 4 n=1 Tax=Hepatospora eriocheir TaxID=1081669 RepID=A0A1X0QKS9_9MICR|nr:ADP/ATP carrier protein 4 [Hepatospora eriocheir]